MKGFAVHAPFPEHKILLQNLCVLLLVFSSFSCFNNKSNPTSPDNSDDKWTTGKVYTYDLTAGEAEISDILIVQ